MVMCLVRHLIVFKFLNSIRFAPKSSHVDDFNTRNKILTAKLLKPGFRYHKLRRAFSKFYRRHFDIGLNIMSDGNNSSARRFRA